MSAFRLLPCREHFRLGCPDCGAPGYLPWYGRDQLPPAGYGPCIRYALSTFCLEVHP